MEISDEIFLEKKVLAVLSSAAGLTDGEGYERINLYLTDFLGQRKIFDEFRDEVSQKAIGTAKRKDASVQRAAVN